VTRSQFWLIEAGCTAGLAYLLVGALRDLTGGSELDSAQWIGVVGGVFVFGNILVRGLWWAARGGLRRLEDEEKES
jgi:hypothetical protein